MQKSKNIFKRVLIAFLTVIFAISPVLLAGCTATGQSSSGDISGGIGGGGNSGDNSSGSSGGSSSGSSGGSSSGSSGNSSENSGGSSGGNSGNSSETPIDKYDPQYYFNGFKFSYRPAKNADAFIIDVRNQNAQFTAEILTELYSNYGYKESSAKLIDVVTYNNTTGFVNISQTSYNFNKKPYFSEDIELKYTDSEGIEKNVLYRGNKVQYDADADYAKYFTHENAILNDSPTATGSQNKWNWISGDNTYGTGYLYFLNNHLYRAKLEFAILLITCGYDISANGGAQYNLYTAGVSQIEAYYNNAEKDVNGLLKDNAKYYNDIYENVTKQYLNIVDHSGFTATEIEKISQFVCEEIIGQEIVALDNTRYVNVYSYERNPNLTLDVIPESLNSKFNRYLTDENMFSIFTTQNNANINLNSYMQKFEYPEGTIEEGIYTAQNQINDFMLYASIVPLICQDYYGQQINKNVEFLDENNYHYNVATDLYKKLFDLNGDDIYHADYFDLDNDGDTTSYVKQVINNQNCIVYSIRKQYFKNYQNTAFDIVNTLANREADDTAREIDNLSKEYPLIPACYFADYYCGELLQNGDINDGAYGDMFHMYSSYQNYQNMVVMPSKQIKLNYVMLAFETLKEFDMHVYARYYDAQTNSFATWGDGTNKTSFYDCGSLLVEVVENDINFIEIDTTEILTTAKINGVAKGNTILDPFANPNEISSGMHQAQIVTKNSVGGRYYEFVELPDGNKVVCFTETNTPQQDRKSYIEFIFSCDISNLYQVGIFMLDFTEAK